MNSKDTTPHFNLGAIIRETGLHPDTLRAWERRYDLPQPTRSEGGHRLYSQRDLEIVQWLIKQQDAGVRISQAVELFKAQVEAGNDPLEESRRPELPIPPLVSGENIAAYREVWVEAALGFDNLRSDQVLNEAFSLFPPESVCLEVLFSGLREIGERWYQGEATVQQEHFASGLVMRRLNALIAGTPPPTRPERILIGAPPEEDHMLSALLLNLILRRAGYDVVYLGADIPLRNFRKTVDELEPNLVILTAHMLVTAAALLEMAFELDGLKVHLAYGGPIFSRMPKLGAAIPGTYLGNDLREALMAVDWALNIPLVEFEPFSFAPEPYFEELKAKMPEIERRVSALFKGQPVLLSAPQEYLSEYLMAAAKLGNIALMESDLEWVSGLLTNFKMPQGALIDFIEGYIQVIAEVLGEPAQPLVDWLTDAKKLIRKWGQK